MVASVQECQKQVNVVVVAAVDENGMVWNDEHTEAMNKELLLVALRQNLEAARAIAS